MRQYVVKEITGSAGRWLDVAPARFPGWIASFAERHGGAAPGTALTVAPSGENVIYTAPDGAVAECHPPFPPVPFRPGDAAAADPAAWAEAIAAHAATPRAVGVLLVRLGGYAAGVFTGSPPELAESKAGARQVHGRSAAGGWSQHRFARRREKQAAEALQAAADAAVTVFTRWEERQTGDARHADNSKRRRPGDEHSSGHGSEQGSGHGSGHAQPKPGDNSNRRATPKPGDNSNRRLPRLDAVVLGGDKRAVAELRADPRLAPYLALAVDRFLTVPDPKLAVLKDTPRLFLAIRIRLSEGIGALPALAGCTGAYAATRSSVRAHIDAFRCRG